jgi:hypothetical protein
MRETEQPLTAAHDGRSDPSKSSAPDDFAQPPDGSHRWGGTMKQVRLEERWNGPRCGWRAVALGACVAAAAGVCLVGCGGQTSVSCGTGTHLSGDSCVVDDDAGRDGGARPGHEAGKGADAGAPRDAAKDGTTKVKDGGPRRPDGAPKDAGVGDAGEGHADASEASVPVSCAALNACVATGTFPGAIDLGSVNPCTGQGVGPQGAFGDRSGWYKVDIQGGCESWVQVFSPPSSLFDVAVYEGSDLGPPPSACPAPLGSAVATQPDGDIAPVASVPVQYGGELYINVIAEADAACASGQTWTLTTEISE